MQRIIINADDLGLNSEVNSTIEHYLKEGKITSSTIMASGEAFAEAVEIAKQYPSCSFGVHLTLDELSPVSRVDALERIGLVKNGLFIKGAYKNLSLNTEVEEVIYDEWKSQILKVINAGVNVSHLDSHHHCHTYSFLPRIVKRLAEELGIKKVRLNLYSPLYIKLYQKSDAINLETKKIDEAPKASYWSKIVSVIKRHAERKSTNRFLKRYFTTVDYFCSLRYYSANERLLKRYNTIELMCHPGHPSYSSETQLLDADCFKDKKLISYLDL